MSLVESLSLLRGGCFLGLRSGSLIFLVDDLWIAVGTDAGGQALTIAFFSSFSPSAFMLNKICSGIMAIVPQMTETCIQILVLQLWVVLAMQVWQLLVIVIWMNKKGDNNLSTERILKSKHIDKDKQKTIPLKHKPSLNKVMLTHLCPQEKLKIGSLIKTLEQRRTENQLLTRQLQQMAGEIEQLRAQLQASRQQFQKVERQLQQKGGEMEEANREVGDLRQKLKNQCKRNDQLSRKWQQQLLRLEGSKQKRSVSLQAEPHCLHQSVQTAIYCAEACAQTEKEQRERDLFYRPHSKSFQKIMKAPLSIQLKTSVNYSRSHQHSRGRSSSHTNQAPNSSEEQDELRHKWDRLKVKHQTGTVQWHDSPHSFHATEQEKDSSRKKPNIKEIDQLALNRMLRLKDFSASKLMRAGPEPPSSAKPCKDSPEVNYLKSPYFNRVQSDSQANTRVVRAGRQPQEINFYESGLFDMNSSRE